MERQNRVPRVDAPGGTGNAIRIRSVSRDTTSWLGRSAVISDPPFARAADTRDQIPVPTCSIPRNAYAEPRDGSPSYQRHQHRQQKSPAKSFTCCLCSAELIDVMRYQVSDPGDGYYPLSNLFFYSAESPEKPEPHCRKCLRMTMESLFDDVSFSQPSRRGAASHNQGSRPTYDHSSMMDVDHDGESRGYPSHQSIQDAGTIKGLQQSLENYRREISRIADESAKNRRQKEDSDIELVRLRAELSNLQKQRLQDSRRAGCFIPNLSQTSGQSQSTQTTTTPSPTEALLQRELLDLRTQVTTKDEHIKDLQAQLRASAVRTIANTPEDSLVLDNASCPRHELKQITDAFRFRVGDSCNSELDAILQNAEQNMLRYLQEQKQMINSQLVAFLHREIGKVEDSKLKLSQHYCELLDQEKYRYQLQVQRQGVPIELSSRNIRTEMNDCQQNITLHDERIDQLKDHVRFLSQEQPFVPTLVHQPKVTATTDRNLAHQVSYRSEPLGQVHQLLQPAIILRGSSQSSLMHPMLGLPPQLHYFSLPTGQITTSNPFLEESMISQVEPINPLDETKELDGDSSLF